MKSKYIQKGLKSMYGSWFLKKLNLKNAVALEKMIFLEMKWSFPDQNFTLITMAQMVFQNFWFLPKIIHSKSPLHFEQLF